MSEVKVAAVSDIHLRNGHQEKLDGELSDLVKKLEEKEPDLVVILGDIIEHGKNT
ncbi:MAG: metallophosphoesterase [Candidatus Nanohaloarchaea archaeon]